MQPGLVRFIQSLRVACAFRLRLSLAPKKIKINRKRVEQEAAAPWLSNPLPV